MKHLVFAFVAVTSLVLWAAKPKEEEIHFDDEDNPVPTGGLIERKDAVPSKPISVVNAQTAVTFTNLSAMIEQCRVYTALPIRENVPNAPVNIEIVATDDKSRLILRPEEFKATVNVRALAADGASPDVVTLRVQKEIMRATLFLLGSGSVNYCITRSARTLKELDKAKFDFPSGATMSHLDLMMKLGIHFIRFSTYRDACKNGWAPAPDTAERKAIWDEYHTKPTKPLEIKFDPKVGK